MNGFRASAIARAGVIDCFSDRIKVITNNVARHYMYDCDCVLLYFVIAESTYLNLFDVRLTNYR